MGSSPRLIDKADLPAIRGERGRMKLATIEQHGARLIVKWHVDPESLPPEDRQRVRNQVDAMQREIDNNPFYQSLRADLQKILAAQGMTLADLEEQVKQKQHKTHKKSKKQENQ